MAAAGDRLESARIRAVAAVDDYAAELRRVDGARLDVAETMDPGQFTGVAKNFEHRIEAQAALAEANRAHQRRYLTISEPLDGIVRIDGLLDAEAGALVRNAVNAGLPPAKDDD